MTMSQKGEVFCFFKVLNRSMVHGPIWINFSLVNLKQCFFEYTKIGDDCPNWNPAFRALKVIGQIWQSGGHFVQVMGSLRTFDHWGDGQIAPKFHDHRWKVKVGIFNRLLKRPLFPIKIHFEADLDPCDPQFQHFEHWAPFLVCLEWNRVVDTEMLTIGQHISGIWLI